MVTGIRPIEHFQELVSSAMARQRVRTNELAEFYLSSLLAGFVTTGKLIDEPLATAYLKALGSAPSREAQLNQMRALGDISLFTSGFFSDSFKRKIIDIDYYMALGTSCYSFVASHDRGMKPLFNELASKFQAFVDVLTEVSARSSLTSSTDILRIYERWLRTKSRLAEKLLREMGIEPVAASAKPVH